MITEVKIQRVGGEGQGVGYDGQNNIYFVPGVVPGDVARVEFSDDSKRYRDARLLEIVTASVDRVAANCPYFSQCGGCDWLHWDYHSQLRAKEQILRHMLERGGLEAERIAPVVPAEKIWGYRNRVQFRREGEKVGFYRKRSHELIDIQKCAVADPRINEALAAIRREPARTGKIEIAVDEKGQVSRWDDRPHAAGGFSQVNPEQNERLRSLVTEQVKVSGARQVLELYAGNGNLTFAYLPHVDRVTAVESNEHAIAQASSGGEEASRDRVRFIKGWVSRGLSRRLKGVPYDTIVLDPPRSGTNGALEALVTPDVRGIIYVSCSPIDFTQDVRSLRKSFVLREIVPLDMFPHTRHIELVARLEKR